jgi:serine/threonine-protein kinase SRPK3
MIDQFQYKIGVPAEELAGYGPGGYHPVRLGDTLDDGRYQILNKLGFGSFSTVWLARDEEYLSCSLLGRYLLTPASGIRRMFL